MNESKYPQELICYIHYNEYDLFKQYPTLVIQGEFGYIGYDIEPESGEILSRVCICAARVPDDCICGGLDE